MVISSFDKFILGGLSLLWIFISINLNTILGLIYLGMVYWYYHRGRDGKVYPIMKGKPELGKTLGISLIIVLAWIYILSGMVGSVAPAVNQDQFYRIFAVMEKPMHPYLVLFIMGVLVPITEELVFRGGLIPYLSTRVQGIILILLNAALFAAFHLVAYNAENQSMIAAFIFGCITSFVVLKSKNLIQAIGIHSVLNTIIMASSLGLLAVGI